MPKTITRSFEVFTYSELSEKAKKNVQEWLIQTNDSCHWEESVISDAKEISALMGWSIERVYWSGFSSQGDGACFVGTMRYAKDCAKNVREYAPQDQTLHGIAAEWQALQRRNFYSLRATVAHSGNYCHEYSAAFDCEDNRHYYGWLNNPAIEKEIAEIARRYMQWIYRQLGAAYEYETSPENIAETCSANEWQFSVDGTFFSK